MVKLRSYIKSADLAPCWLVNVFAVSAWGDRVRDMVYSFDADYLVWGRNARWVQGDVPFSSITSVQIADDISRNPNAGYNTLTSMRWEGQLIGTVTEQVYLEASDMGSAAIASDYIMENSR